MLGSEAPDHFWIGLGNTLTIPRARCNADIATKIDFNRQEKFPDHA